VLLKPVLIVLYKGGTLTTAHFESVLHLTLLIQLISALDQIARLELGVSDKGGIQNVQ